MFEYITWSDRAMIMEGTLKIKRHSRKSAINDLNDFFSDKINPCYENFEPDILNTIVSLKENID